MSAALRLRSLGLAVAAALALVGVSALPAVAVGVASVHGTVTRAGAAVSIDERVRVYSVVDSTPTLVRTLSVDAGGAYAVDDLPPGDYTLLFLDTTPGSHYSPLYWQGATYYPQATVFSLAAGDVKTADAQLQLGGSATVSVVEGPLKTPSVGATVVFLSETSPGSSYTTAPTGPSGIVVGSNLPPGVWTVKILKSGYFTEYFNDRDSEAGGDRFTVTAGSSTDPLPVWLRSDVAPSSTFFQDVPNTSSFFSAIDFLASHGISTGTPVADERPLYKPLDVVSRQAMAQFLYRLSGDTFSPPATPTFADVPTTSSFFTAVEWMAANGITTGTPQPTGRPLFKPADTVSRSAMALFLFRRAAPSFSAPAEPTFADVPATASWYTAVEWMASAGISTGTTQRGGLKPLYKPLDPVSRQAMALFLFRAQH